MYYTIHHVTRFRYSAPVSESVLELRMQPRADGGQHRVRCQITLNPYAQLSSYRDYLGNTIHYFDVPGRHARLTITAEAHVETSAPPPLPDTLGPDAWAQIDQLAQTEAWDFVTPSHFARPTELLRQLARELDVRRRGDPLRLLRELNSMLFDCFDYAPNTTQVDSPIDDALQSRQGVCQDFAHVMTALVREVGIPCRYISGYLHHSKADHDRSDPGASHAWVEALLPGLGWVGFDPTNNLLAGERHIRVAVGRDYADVPPTRGVFKGRADQLLEVAVRVASSDTTPEIPEPVAMLGWTPPPEADEIDQQQQQQQ